MFLIHFKSLSYVVFGNTCSVSQFTIFFFNCQIITVLLNGLGKSHLLLNDLGEFLFATFSGNGVFNDYEMKISKFIWNVLLDHIWNTLLVFFPQKVHHRFVGIVATNSPVCSSLTSKFTWRPITRKMRFLWFWSFWTVPCGVACYFGSVGYHDFSYSTYSFISYQR